MNNMFSAIDLPIMRKGQRWQEKAHLKMGRKATCENVGESDMQERGGK